MVWDDSCRSLGSLSGWTGKSGTRAQECTRRRTGRDCSTAFNSAALWPLAPVWTSGVTGVVGKSVIRRPACRRFLSLLEFDGTALLELDGAGLSNARGAAVDAYGEMSVLADTPKSMASECRRRSCRGGAGSCWRLVEEMPSDLVLRESLLTLSAGSNTPLWRRSEVRDALCRTSGLGSFGRLGGEIQRQMLLARPLPQRQHGCGSREEGEV